MSGGRATFLGVANWYPVARREWLIPGAQISNARIGSASQYGAICGMLLKRGDVYRCTDDTICLKYCG